MNKPVLCFLSLVFIAASAISADAKEIVITIKPLHSLVQGVMGETGEAKLLIEGATTPHGFALRPSHMNLLQASDAIFFIDEGFETFLETALSVAPAELQAIPVVETADLPLLDRREGGAWDSHEHEAHSEKEDQSHHPIDDHDHLDKNLHVWLDTDNARLIVTAVTRELSDLYPENKAAYEENAHVLFGRLDLLDAEIAQKLQAVKDMPFVVLHDAYPYFERKYGLNGVGTITIEPNSPASIKDLRDIRRKIEELGAVCIFREPQFNGRLVRTAAEGSAARTGTLDPIGADIPAGPDHYFLMMSALAENFVACASN